MNSLTNIRIPFCQSIVFIAIIIHQCILVQKVNRVQTYNKLFNYKEMSYNFLFKIKVIEVNLDISFPC